MTTSQYFPVEFYKGHGTQNDFIILPDEHGELDLTPEFIAALCDRQRGIGADGVLRVARTTALADKGLIDATGSATFFMDYYNADGSIAEMCGNGTRVFAHWLVAHNWVQEASFSVGTRAGDKPVTLELHDDAHATVSVAMGEVSLLGDTTITLGEDVLPALGVDVGNPHAVVVNPDWQPADIATLDLQQLGFDPNFFPQGVNIELATPIIDGVMTMRVLERGVGETRSCGTGTVATARAGLAQLDQSIGKVQVNIPGGSVVVEISAAGATLTGPSQLVAQGVVAKDL